MTDERNQQLADLFARSTKQLHGEEFAATVRSRVVRHRYTKRLWKVLLLALLLAFGVLYSSRIDEALLRLEAHINQVLERYAFDSPLGGQLLAAIAAVSLMVCVRWRRRTRR